MPLRAAILAFLTAATPASASIAYVQGQIVPNNAANQTPEVRISAGQSWDTNYYSGMVGNGFSQMAGAFYQPGLTNGNFPTGIMPISAGINLPATAGGLTSFEPGDAWPVSGKASDTGDALSIGRTSVLAQQWLRWTNAPGVALTPIIEFNNGCPSSSWLSGPCGGLGPPNATFTGSQSTTVLTVTNFVGGPLVAGNYVISPGGVSRGQISAFGTGGTTGTGGAGTYSMSVSASVSAEAETNSSGAWVAETALVPVITAALPSATLRLNAAVYRSVLWVQGGSFDTATAAPTINEWTAMQAAYDALALPGTTTTPLRFYLPIRAANTDSTQLTNAVVGGIQFVRANANGRTIGACPWYQWEFTGADNIHLGNYGTMREGECVGLAAYTTEDQGTLFKPLWLSLTGSITVSGQTVTVPFDRPTGASFATGTLQFYWDATDGLKAWPQQGFHVKRNGVDLTVTPAISGLNVQLVIAEALSHGDVLEVSYAYYGPGGPSPGTVSGVGGNLRMTGPASMLFPGKTIDSWAWPFIESVVI